MDGILYTIDKLGRENATLRGALEQAQQELALLRQQLAAKADEPTDAPS